MSVADGIKTQAEVRKNYAMLDICGVCNNYIHLMCRKGTGICSENCDKESKNA